MSKVTAVEWLIDKINHTGWGNIMIDIPKEFIEQAKAMEKEQIIDAYEIGFDEGIQIITKYDTAQDYYNETYDK